MSSRTTAAGFSLIFAACALSAAGAGAGATVEVHLVNAAFVPATVHINASDTVMFINDDSFAHDVTFETGPSSGSAGGLAPHANWSRSFDANGVFKFRCMVHSTDFATGMVGSVTVGPTAPPPPPKSPGFEIVGALAAIGAVAFVALRRRSA